MPPSFAAASRLFHERGLDAPSLDDICAAAGYTRGAFYVHFKDREELIIAVARENSHRRMDSIIASAGEALDLERTVHLFATHAVTSGAYPGIGAVKVHQFLGALDRSPQLRAAHLNVIAEAKMRLTQAAREGQEAGTVRPDVDAAAIAEILLTLVAGVEQLIEQGSPPDVSAAANGLLRMLRPMK